MNKIIYIFFIVSILIGCNRNVIKENKDFSMIDSNVNSLSIKEIDSLKKNDELQLFEYQNLTIWGGLKIYYYQDKLVMVKGTHNSETSSFFNLYYFNTDLKISKIIDNQLFRGKSVSIKINKEGNIENNSSLESKSIDLIEKSIESANSLLKFIRKNEEEIKTNSKIFNSKIKIGNNIIFIKSNSDYTSNFLSELNQEGIELKYLIDSFYIIGDGTEDTFQFPELPRFGEDLSFEGEKDGLVVNVWINRKNYNSIAFHINIYENEQTYYSRKGVAEIGAFFYHGAETDINIKTGNGYLSTEFSDEYNNCYIGIRIGRDGDTGEILCKLKKNCNNKIQDITLDNFPNLKLKKK